jgi:hypothetical protein
MIFWITGSSRKTMGSMATMKDAVSGGGVPRTRHSSTHGPGE